MKHKILLVSIFLMGITGFAGIKFFTPILDSKSSAIVISSEALWVADFNDKKNLVGLSDNVFIGEVIEQVGEEDLTGNPNTQFSVKVLTNIKGNLEGNVIVNQEGGYYKEDGKLYLILTEHDELLIPNKTYLFSSNLIPEKNWHHLTADYGTIEIADNAEKSRLLEEFKTAYKNENTKPFGK